MDKGLKIAASNMASSFYPESAVKLISYQCSTKPGRKHLATLVSLRGLGKREAQKHVALLKG